MCLLAICMSSLEVYIQLLCLCCHYKWDCFLNFSFCQLIVSLQKHNRFLHVALVLCKFTISFIISNSFFVDLRVFWPSLMAQMVKICLQCTRHSFDPWVRKTPWRRECIPLQSSFFKLVIYFNWRLIALQYCSSFHRTLT